MVLHAVDGRRLLWYGPSDSASNFFRVSRGGSLHITDIEFRGGKADYGGALAVDTRSHLRAERVTFDQCLAHVEGGAVRVKGSSGLELRDVAFTACSSMWYGGAVFASGTRGILANVSFVKTAAAHDGGAIYAVGKTTKSEYGHFDVQDATFVGTASTFRGGAIYLGAGVNLSVSDALVTGASSTQGGGAYIEGNSAHMRLFNVSFNNSNAVNSHLLK